MKKDEKTKKIDPTDNPILTEFENKIEELTLGWQRCQADFQNYRRQTEEDKKRLIKMANADLMLEILPVLDNFQLAAKHVPAELEQNNWTQGIKQIEKQLENILESSGLVKVNTIDCQFDPNFHEAIEHVASDKPEDMIVDVAQAGYIFDDICLRPAKVKVSKGQK